MEEQSGSRETAPQDDYHAAEIHIVIFILVQEYQARISEYTAPLAN